MIRATRRNTKYTKYKYRVISQMLQVGKAYVGLNTSTRSIPIKSTELLCVAIDFRSTESTSTWRATYRWFPRYKQRKDSTRKKWKLQPWKCNDLKLHSLPLQGFGDVAYLMYRYFQSLLTFSYILYVWQDCKMIKNEWYYTMLTGLKQLHEYIIQSYLEPSYLRG